MSGPQVITFGCRLNAYESQLIAGIAVILFIFGATGASRIKVENRFIDYFKTDTPIYEGMTLIDERLGGTTPVEVVLEAEGKLAEAEAEWEAQREAQITEGLAAAQRALSHEPLTQTRLNEARVAYQGVLVLQAGHAPAQAGLAMLEKLEESLAGLDAEEFTAAEDALAEAKTHARAVGLESDVLASVQKRLTGAQAAPTAQKGPVG